MEHSISHSPKKSEILEFTFQEKWSHFQYLGLLISKEIFNTKIWNKNIDKTKQKVYNWSIIWFNMAGRVVLIKALLTTLPIYQYATILAPTSIHKQIELVIKGFVWQGGKFEIKKHNLVKWDEVTLPYEKGGLAIRLPGIINLALGAKITWIFIIGERSWWKQILEAKYMNHNRS